MPKYLLDGYNIIYASIFINKKGTIQQKRNALINYIKKKNIKDITIVFDAKNEPINYTHRIYQPNIVFTHNMSADDYIIKTIEKAENKNIFIVVTDDRELQLKVKLLGAEYMKVNEFFHTDKKETTKDESKPDLSYKELKEIEEKIKSKAGDGI